MVYDYYSLTEEELSAIIGHYRNGVPIPEIDAIYNVDQNELEKYIKSYLKTAE